MYLNFYQYEAIWYLELDSGIYAYIMTMAMANTSPKYEYASPLLPKLTKSGIKGTVKLTELITSARDVIGKKLI